MKNNKSNFSSKIHRPGFWPNCNKCGMQEQRVSKLTVHLPAAAGTTDSNSQLLHITSCTSHKLGVRQQPTYTALVMAQSALRILLDWRIWMSSAAAALKVWDSRWARPSNIQKVLKLSNYKSCNLGRKKKVNYRGFCSSFN